MIRAKGLGRVLAGIASLGMMASAAHASTYFVEQETAPNSGIFTTVGKIKAFDASGLSTVDAYKYDNGLRSSYNGNDNGLPDPVNGAARLFLVDTSDGLSLFLVLDGPGPNNGSADLEWTVSNDTAAALVNDDNSEAPTTDGINFSYSFDWFTCCTDGFAIGSLDGDFAIEGAFTSFSGLNLFEAVSAGGGTVGLTLANDQAVRLSQVPVPAAAPLAAAGFAGLFGANARRRRKAS
ncbi:MAG: hypothetical protein AAGH41_04880 [Pseudomonadota bacterium]